MSEAPVRSPHIHSANYWIEVSVIINGVHLDGRTIRLLEYIEEYGQMKEACLKIGMHQRIAKELVERIGKSCGAALTSVQKGGRKRGATMLTETGAKIVRVYRQIEQDIKLNTIIELNALARECDLSQVPAFNRP